MHALADPNPVAALADAGCAARSRSASPNSNPSAPRPPMCRKSRRDNPSQRIRDEPRSRSIRKLRCCCQPATHPSSGRAPSIGISVLSWVKRKPSWNGCGVQSPHRGVDHPTPVHGAEELVRPQQRWTASSVWPTIRDYAPVPPDSLRSPGALFPSPLGSKTLWSPAGERTKDPSERSEPGRLGLLLFYLLP